MKNKENLKHPGFFGLKTQAFIDAARHLKSKYTEACITRDLTVPEMHFKHVYGFMYAFSLELLFKTIIYTENIILDNEPYQSWDKKHSIKDLSDKVIEIAAKYQFPLNNIDANFLKKIRHLIVSGKYPFPLDIEERSEAAFSPDQFLEDDEIKYLEKIFENYVPFLNFLSEKYFKIYQEDCEKKLKIRTE